MSRSTTVTYLIAYCFVFVFLALPLRPYLVVGVSRHNPRGCKFFATFRIDVSKRLVQLVFV